jgi:hypothetical protein
MHLFVDGAYDRAQLKDKVVFLDFVIDVMRRLASEQSFNVLPKRWVIERTSA